jgi:twitching motility protein PilT
MRDKGQDRADGRLPVLSGQETREVVYSILNDDQRKALREPQAARLRLRDPGVARFRVNCFFQRGSVSAAFRLVPAGHPQPRLARRAAGAARADRRTARLRPRHRPDRLGKVDDPGGDDRRDQLERQDHILTIEDPIEFLHQHKRSIVNQREVGLDARDFALGLRAALREDPT